MPTQVGSITGAEGTAALSPARPAGVGEGDIILVVVTEYNSSDPITSGTTVTGGSAFTRIVEAGAQDGPEPMWVQVFAKVAGAAEPGTYSVSAPPSPGYRVARVLAFDGDDTDPTVLVGGSFGTGDNSAASISLAGVTFGRDGSLGLIVGHEWDWHLPPPDVTWTEVGTNVGANYVWTKPYDSGATGTIAWNATGNTGRAAALIGLQPPGVGPPGPTVVRTQTAMPNNLPGDMVTLVCDGGSYVGERKLIYWQHGGLGDDVADFDEGQNSESMYDLLAQVVLDGDGEYIVIGGDDGVSYDDGIESYSNGMSYGNPTGVAAMDAVIDWARGEFDTDLNVCVTGFSAGALTAFAWSRDHRPQVAGIVTWDGVVDTAFCAANGLTKMPDYLESAFGGPFTGLVPEDYAPSTALADRIYLFTECSDSTVPNGQSTVVDGWWDGPFTLEPVTGSHHDAGNIDVEDFELWLSGLVWEPSEVHDTVGTVSLAAEVAGAVSKTSGAAGALSLGVTVGDDVAKTGVATGGMTVSLDVAAEAEKIAAVIGGVAVELDVTGDVSSSADRSTTGVVTLTTLLEAVAAKDVAAAGALALAVDIAGDTAKTTAVAAGLGLTLDAVGVVDAHGEDETTGAIALALSIVAVAAKTVDVVGALDLALGISGAAGKSATSVGAVGVTLSTSGEASTAPAQATAGSVAVGLAAGGVVAKTAFAVGALELVFGVVGIVGEIVPFIPSLARTTRIPAELRTTAVVGEQRRHLVGAP